MSDRTAVFWRTWSLPRPLRPIADGLVYHVINRGNNRQDVFHKQQDFQAFLQALADLKERKPFKLYGYCLMSNHFHLLVRPTGASISRIVQSLLVSHRSRKKGQNYLIDTAGGFW